MTAPRKFIRIVQGPTTAVFRLQADSSVLAVEVLHRPAKPVLFRRATGRKFKCNA